MKFYVVPRGHTWHDCPGPVILDHETNQPTDEWTSQCTTVWESLPDLARLHFHKYVCCYETNTSTKATFRGIVRQLEALGVPG